MTGHQKKRDAGFFSRISFSSGSDRYLIDSHPKVRMYNGWYTKVVIIRTFGKGFKGISLVAFAVVYHQLQMIIEDVDGVDEGFDDMTAEERIFPVAFGELLEEEDHPVAVHQLGLGETEGLTADAEVFSGGLQAMELCDGGG